MDAASSPASSAACAPCAPCPPASSGPSLGELLIVGASTASAGLCAYHGFRRHEGSIGWALLWSTFGGLFPGFAPALALAQGLGRPKDAPPPWASLASPAPGAPLTLSQKTRSDQAILERLRLGAI